MVKDVAVFCLDVDYIQESQSISCLCTSSDWNAIHLVDEVEWDGCRKACACVGKNKM